MFPRLHVTMLGRFELWAEVIRGERAERRSLSLPATVKSQSLLAYLLLHRHTPQCRDVLAEMFWPGRPPRRARRSLSTALWRIRRDLAPFLSLEGDHQSVQLRAAAEIRVDVETFESALREAIDTAALQRAATLGEGEFLPGFYEDWVIRRRERQRMLLRDALVRLMREYESRADDSSALKIAQRVLEIDACNEAAHRLAMRAYSRMGEQAAALAQYRRCQEVLAKEMAATPSAKTQQLFRQLQMAERAPSFSHANAAKSMAAFIAEPEQPGAPPLVGRRREMERLHSRWQQAMEGRGGVLFVDGEAGIGKTRLLMSLAERARRQEGRVIGVQCYEYEQGQPYGALVDVMKGALAIGGKAVIPHMSPWQAANLAKLAPEVQDLLPQDARRMTGIVAEQKLLLNALTRLLIYLAHQAPLLLLIDDLQWAHDSTLVWLPVLAREIASQPLLLVTAYRIEETSPDGLLTRIVTRLESENLAESLTLPRLSLQALADWLQGLDAESIEQIHRHTEGNPFFILETVRSLVEQGHLRYIDGLYQAREKGFSPPLPETVRHAIENRLSALTPMGRQGLAAAAVIGRAFDLDVWMQVWGQEEETALEALDEFMRRRLVRKGEGAFAHDYEFDHHLVQEAVYHTLPRRRCRQLHLVAARTLQARRAGEPGLSASIALHYLRAGEPRLARPWLLQAGDQAVALAATKEALDYYRRALAAYPNDAAHAFERAILERKIGDAFFRRGDYEQAESHLREALQLLQRPFPRLGRPLHQALALALLRQIAHRLNPRKPLVASRAAPALREEVAAYTSLGWIYSLQSRYEEYLLVSLRALNASEKAGYARGVAVAATALGIAADFMGRFGLAEHFHRRARAAVAEVAQPADAGFVAFGQAYHAYLRGDENGVLEQAALAATKYRQVGDAHRWTLAMMLRAYVMVHRGNLGQVRAWARELAQVGEEMNDLEARCAAASLFALTERWQGRWEEAAAHYQQAAARARQIPDAMSEVENLAGMARCQVRLGRWSQARKTLTAAKEVVSEHEVRGDALGKYRIAAFEAALWAAEHQTDARSRWLRAAKQAMRETLRETRTFRPSEPEVWRLCGRYEWLRGRPDAAQKWWEKSLKRAEALNQR
ncbi:MAG: AAA family ATPase, partial [Chloroflexi bacterium]|nr:AAA family ATPase [Chloroflexota bacterium]